MADDRARPEALALAARVAAFELRLLLRSPVFWIVVGISALMVVGSLTLERIQVGPLRTGSRTSVEAILLVHLVWSLFFLFTAAAFSAASALRDEEAGYGHIVQATAAPPRAIALGRCAATLAAVLLSFVSVPVAALLAPYAPWAGPLAPPDPGAVAFGALVLAVPNLVLATTAFFALARVARSGTAAYLGAVAFLILYGLGSGEPGDPGWFLSLLDPFGFAASRFATEAWTGEARATVIPPIWGALGINRLVWLAVAAGAVLLATRWRPPTRSPRPEPAAGRHPAPVTRLEPVARSFDRQTAFVQFAARLELELGLILRSRFFAVLILLGLANVLGTLVQLPPEAPRLAAMARVDEAFRLVPIVVALFWAGELVWAEHDAGLDEIVGSCPIPSWALVLPKVLALIVILAGSLGSAALAASALDGWRAGAIPSADWMIGLALPRIWDAGLLAVLAVFFQALSPGKLAGFGLMVLYLIVSLALETAGLRGDLYRYGGGSGSLALAEVGGAHALLVRLYWTGVAALLLLAAQTLISRSVDVALGPRLARAIRSLGPIQRLLALAAASATALLGVALCLGG